MGIEKLNSVTLLLTFGGIPNPVFWLLMVRPALCLFLLDALKAGILPIADNTPMPPITAAKPAWPKLAFLLVPSKSPVLIRPIPPYNKTRPVVFWFWLLVI